MGLVAWTLLFTVASAMGFNFGGVNVFSDGNCMTTYTAYGYSTTCGSSNFQAVGANVLNLNGNSYRLIKSPDGQITEVTDGTGKPVDEATKKMVIEEWDKAMAQAALARQKGKEVMQKAQANQREAMLKAQEIQQEAMLRANKIQSAARQQHQEAMQRANEIQRIARQQHKEAMRRANEAARLGRQQAKMARKQAQKMARWSFGGDDDDDDDDDDGDWN